MGKLRKIVLVLQMITLTLPLLALASDYIAQQLEEEDNE